MMTKRENMLSLYRRTGYEKVPVEFILSPAQIEKYRAVTGSDKRYEDYFGFSSVDIEDGVLCPEDQDLDRFKHYFPNLKPDTVIDRYGVGHEKGSAAAMHMTYMLNPLRDCESLEEMKAYPFPDFSKADFSGQKALVDEAHAKGLAACGNMQTTIWETAWYIRSMEELLMDMQVGDPMADYILEKVTENSIIRAAAYATAGCDLIYLGDDVGMQRTALMSDDMYCTYLKPRMKRIVNAIRAVNPDVIVLYHSCGFCKPYIDHFIDIGVDVLNPVQPECMDFKEIHDMYGDRLSFSGTIGTQSTMPFGTPDDVRRKVFENLDIAGDRGGLLCCPTHMLEPDVPWENIEAYVKACEDYK